MNQRQKCKSFLQIISNFHVFTLKNALKCIFCVSIRHNHPIRVLSDLSPRFPSAILQDRYDALSVSFELFTFYTNVSVHFPQLPAFLIDSMSQFLYDN